MPFLLSLLGNWKQIGALIIVLAVGFVWLRFQHIEAALRAKDAALVEARALLAAAEVELALNETARAEAQASERVNTVTRVIVREAEREIADAAQREDAHGMYSSWRVGIISLRDAAPEPIA